jgi:hypothetical protein
VVSRRCDRNSKFEFEFEFEFGFHIRVNWDEIFVDSLAVCEWEGGLLSLLSFRHFLTAGSIGSA